MIMRIFPRVENIAVKGENAGYQHFLIFQTMFSEGTKKENLICSRCMEKGPLKTPKTTWKHTFIFFWSIAHGNSERMQKNFEPPWWPSV